MALTAITLLCFAALLPFPGLGGSEEHSGKQGPIPIKVIVINKFNNTNISYSTTATVGMPIFGILNQLHDKNNFNFTYTINKSYGIFLESVNGLAGSTERHTYWELLSKKGNSITQLNVGIGCYQPKKNENFIMNFTTWD
ncbi:transcobalamin beta b [Carassius carassius]|uniref:transcobalamin beta b n=1 Tax=Carassius carassius TaxID=217509 RepID=UPI0028686A2A|nr:transcobalamin beta b [Carassius carassius]